MAVYYIDPKTGDNRNSGLDEQHAKANDRELSLLPGDAVLYRRGSLIRDVMHNQCGAPGRPITYSAYGEGEPPTFCGSTAADDPAKWREEEENIWSYPIADELGNIVFNHGEHFGALRWSKGELTEQGDFYDDCFGFRIEKKEIPKDHRIYVYSKMNPANYYRSVELCNFGPRIMANNGHDMVIENLRFINAGVHVLAGERESRDLVIRNCSFERIGGGVWDRNQKIRYGNAVEFWNIAENIEVSDCIFDNIYDSAVTHQGMEHCKPCVNVCFLRNVFQKCGMAAYEQRDKFPLSASFCDNICVDAGEGFSKLGEVMPRFSEIWPEPMGHHIFLWRIEDAKKGSLEIKRNIFYNAPYGAAVYSIIAEEAENRIDMEENLYYTENRDLVMRWHAHNYQSFKECAYIDPKGKFEKIDIQSVLKERIEKIRQNQMQEVKL